MEKHMDNQLIKKKSTSLYLVAHKHMLTWENLKKKRIHRAFHLPICIQAKETMEHLLNQFHFNLNIWDDEPQVMCTLDHHRDSVPNTISNWHLSTYKNFILNRI